MPKDLIQQRDNTSVNIGTARRNGSLSGEEK